MSNMRAAELKHGRRIYQLGHECCCFLMRVTSFSGPVTRADSQFYLGINILSCENTL